MASREQLEIVIKAQDRASKVFGSIGGSAKTLAGGLGKIGVAGAAGVATLVGSLGAAGAAMISLASDAEEMQAKFDTVFEGFAGETQEALDEFAATVGRNKFELRGFAAQLGDTFKPLGFATETASDMSVVLTRLAVDLASFNNLRTEDVIADLQSALVGNTETLRKYGIVANQAAIEQEAIKKGFAETTVDAGEVQKAMLALEKAHANYTDVTADHAVESLEARMAADKVRIAEEKLAEARAGNVEALTAQQKAQAILSLTLKGSQDAIGDATDTAGSWANQMRALQSTLSETATTMGQELLPIVGPMLQGFVQWARDVAPLLIEKFKEFASELSVTVGPAMDLINDALQRISIAFGGTGEDVSAGTVVIEAFGKVLDAIVIGLQAFALGMQGVAFAVEHFTALWQAMVEAVNSFEMPSFPTLGGIGESITGLFGGNEAAASQPMTGGMPPLVLNMDGERVGQITGGHQGASARQSAAFGAPALQ